MGSGVLWKIIVTQQSPLLHQKMQLEIVLCRGRNVLFLCRNIAEFSWPEVLWDQKSVETCSLVRRVHISACFWVKWTSDSACQRGKRPSRLLPQKKWKNQPVMVSGCIRAHGMGDLHICESTIDAAASVGILERYKLPSRWWTSQKPHVYFSRTMPGPILHDLQQHGFIGIDCVCFTGLPAVQICLILKMYGASWRGESDNGDYGLLSRSSLVCTKNGQKFHL